MSPQEAKHHQQRLLKFNFLDAARSALHSTLAKMSEKSGYPGTVQSHADPFTGDTRESRRVAWLKIGFTATLGGEPPVELDLNYLNIPAWEFGNALEAAIKKQIAALNAAIEKL